MHILDDGNLNILLRYAGKCRNNEQRGKEREIKYGKWVNCGKGINCRKFCFFFACAKVEWETKYDAMNFVLAFRTFFTSKMGWIFAQ